MHSQKKTNILQPIFRTSKKKLKLIMDQETASRLIHQYGVILLLDTPLDGTLDLGIDTNIWALGPKFKGIKLIPLGIHYFYFRFV